MKRHWLPTKGEVTTVLLSIGYVYLHWLRATGGMR